MIKEIYITNPMIAREFLELQKLAYQIEAELIGYDQLPPLRETIDQLLESTEACLGYYVANKLVGAISYELEQEGASITSLTICKMIVHPQYFKQGIASQLIQHLLDLCASKQVDEMMVSTGSKNIPAIQLYQKFGFVTHREQRIDANLTLITLKRHLNERKE